MKDDKLQFWHKSADKEPGKGTGEYINKDSDYSKLKKIKDWRKKLSNEYLVKFKLSDVNDWESVDEFCKYRADDYNYIDALKLALFAKFTQDKSCKNILLNTKNADLYYKKKNKWVLFQELMLVRECIRNYDSQYDLEKISHFQQELVAKILKYPVKKQIYWAQDRVLVKFEDGRIKKGTVTSRVHLPDTTTAYNIQFDDGTYEEYVPAEYVIEKIN